MNWLKLRWKCSESSRGVINQFGSDLVGDLIAEELANVIEVGLGEALEPLQRIPLSQDAQPPIPAIDLEIGLEPKAPRFVPRGYFELAFSGQVGSSQSFEPPYMTLSVPAFELAQNRHGLRMRVLRRPFVSWFRMVWWRSLWRQGVLRLDLSSAIPMGLFGITSAQVDGRLPP